MAFGIDTQGESRVPFHPSEHTKGGKKWVNAFGSAPQGEDCLCSLRTCLPLGQHIIVEGESSEVLGPLPRPCVSPLCRSLGIIVGGLRPSQSETELTAEG